MYSIHSSEYKRLNWNVFDVRLTIFVKTSLKLAKNRFHSWDLRKRLTYIETYCELKTKTHKLDIVVKSSRKPKIYPK